MSSPLADRLRQIILAHGSYATAKLAGIDPGIVARFVTHKRGITLDTADRIAAALGLQIVEVARRPARPRISHISHNAAPETKTEIAADEALADLL